MRRPFGRRAAALSMAREPTTTRQGDKSRMVDQRDSLAREIDEELRREQLLKPWERYGIHAIAAVVLVIAGIGGYKYYEHRRALAAEAAGASLVSASREAGNKAETQKALEEIAASAPAGYALLARLRLAAAARDAGKTAEAAAAFE